MSRQDNMIALIALFAAFLCGAAVGGIGRGGGGAVAPDAAPVLAQK